MPVEMRRPVTRIDANPPYGSRHRVLAVVPAMAVTLSPAQAVVPLARGKKRSR